MGGGRKSFLRIFCFGTLKLFTIVTMNTFVALKSISRIFGKMTFWGLFLSSKKEPKH
jgi:hypothetical protein